MLLVISHKQAILDDTYGTIPRVATADGRERIPTETFSEIITNSLVRLSRPGPNEVVKFEDSRIPQCLEI